MNNKKRLGIFIFLILVFTTSCGVLEKGDDFLKNKKDYTVEEKKQMVLEHLKEKYAEEFVVYTYSLANPIDFQEDDIFKVYPKNMTEKDLVFVYGEYDKEKGYYFYDSYFEILIKDRYEEYIKNLISDLYKDYYVVMNEGENPNKAFSNTLNRDTEINKIYFECLKEGNFFRPTVNVYIKNNKENRSIKEISHEIINRVFEKNILLDMYIYIVKEEKYEDLIKKGGNIYPPECFDKKLLSSQRNELMAEVDKQYFIGFENKKKKMEYNYKVCTSAPSDDNYKIKIYYSEE